MQISDKFELKKHGKAYRFFNGLLKNPYVLVAPAILSDLGLCILPTLLALMLSMCSWEPLTGEVKFVGWKNFRYLIHSEDFGKVLANTIIFMLAIVFIGLLLKIILGVFLNKRTFMHNFAQTIMFTPHLVSSVSIAVIFMILMSPKNGVFNTVLNAVGLPSSYWFMGEKTSLLSIIIVTIWQGMGYGVLLVIAALRGIPEYIYEAAKLDRSKPINTFAKITIPMISPTLLYMVVTTVCSAFTSYDTVSLMTEGGPDNSSNLIAYYVYQQGIAFRHYGRAAAAAVILLIFTATLSALNFFVLDRRTHYR